MSVVTLFLINLLFAILWMFLWDGFNMYFLVAGFALGYLLLSIMGRSMPVGKAYASKVVQLISFTAYFFKILIQANLQVAWEIITPQLHMQPRFVRYPVQGLTDFQITSFANAITLTPGTMTIDVSEDNRYLYVHCMYARDRQSAIAELDGLLDRMKREFFS